MILDAFPISQFINYVPKVIIDENGGAPGVRLSTFIPDTRVNIPKQFRLNR